MKDWIGFIRTVKLDWEVKAVHNRLYFCEGDDMTDEVILERYRELAAAAILQGINDYLDHNSKETEEGLKRWIDESSLFDYLGLSRDYVYKQVLKLKKEGVCNLKGVKRYGKKDI